MIKLQLHENWQLCNIRQLDWIPAQIPGDIYAALLKTGKMPDPFFGDNEYQAKALMEEDYEYRTVFNYEEAQFKDCQEVILRFDGIDTIADIYLNGCCLGKVDNMHRIWEFPVGECPAWLETEAGVSVKVALNSTESAGESLNGIEFAVLKAKEPEFIKKIVETGEEEE